MNNYVIYCSASEFAKFKPDHDTIIVTLDDQLAEKLIVKNDQVKKHVRYGFKVIEPQGREGSFRPMDDQAKAIGVFLAELLKDHTGLIIIQCTYGEIRSPAVAMGVFVGTDRDLEIGTLHGGKIVKGEPESFNIFQSRTMSFVADGFE